MLKGCQREMIMLETRGSTVFESAWLVLRRDKPAVSQADMLAEANRLIGAADKKGRKWGKRAERVLFFAMGAVIGGGIFALFCLFTHV